MNRPPRGSCSAGGPVVCRCWTVKSPKPTNRRPTGRRDRASDQRHLWSRNPSHSAASDDRRGQLASAAKPRWPGSAVRLRSRPAPVPPPATGFTAAGTAKRTPRSTSSWSTDCAGTRRPRLRSARHRGGKDQERDHLLPQACSRPRDLYRAQGRSGTGRHEPGRNQRSTNRCLTMLRSIHSQPCHRRIHCFRSVTCA